MRRILRGVAGGVMMAGLLCSAPASAQGTPAGGKPAPAGPTASSPAATTAEPQVSDAKKDEARQRYQRGLQLFNEANYEAARVEFERAYQLAPSYKILYNIGLCYEQLGDYVQAQSTLQRYLEIGGKEISEERRSEVAKELAQIRPRIAKVTIKSNVAGAEALVDDVCSTDANSGNVNCGAFDGTQRIVLMNPGRRRVTLRKEGFLPETQVLSVAGSDQTEIVINMKKIPDEYHEKKNNPYVVPMWIGWGVTAGGLVAAGIFGYLASEAQSDQEALNNQFNATKDQRDEARDKTVTLSTATDGILIGSGVAAIVATYFTIRTLGWKDTSGNSVKVEVGGNRIGVGGTF